ncbi:Lysophospholipase L1 [Olivibacter domesticus]|uniref:Lysophospholipase L1 n=2 Tax=Olivibacter domesticus TaxID=407022 RepID=A0A1H7Y0K2_OLID1|nr:Lysophospholipase L1 [Olivibacter domesticus]
MLLIKSEKMLRSLLFVGFMLTQLCSYAQQSIQKYSFIEKLPGYTFIGPHTFYADKQASGYDLIKDIKKGTPFYFSTKAAEGNYQITIQVKANDGVAGSFTVKAESRRLMLLNTPLKAGQSTTKTFTVNIKDRQITNGVAVKLKPREFTKLDWDEKLTIEFDATHCSLQTLTITKGEEHFPTIYLAGNSTVVNQEDEPWASWGQMITAFFNPKVAIANHAESGLSLGSFLSSKRLDKVLSVMQPNDYLFIEFGHNDQKEKGHNAGAYGSYTDRLRFFVKAVRAKQGIPVILTSTNRRSFDENGRITNSLGDFPEAARKVAAELNVPLIDLNKMTKVLYETLGVEPSKKAFVHYPANTYPAQHEALEDNTHFNTYGAYQIAQCVLQGIREKVPSLVVYIKENAPVYNPARPGALADWNWPESPRADSTKPDGN